MPKKTASRTRGQPKVRVNPDSGLIAKAEEPRQSARAKSALDNRSHRTSRRLACDASVVEVKRGSDGSVLDVGRRTRTIPPALRRALEIRDGGCRFPGCGLRFTEGHHVVHWGDGGETSLSNLLLLCRHHHRAVHEEGFRVRARADGAFRFFDRTGWPLPDRAPLSSVGGRVGCLPGARRRPVIRGTPTASPSLPSPDEPNEPVERLTGENRGRGVRPDALTPSATWKTEADIPWGRTARVWEALDSA